MSKREKILSIENSTIGYFTRKKKNILIEIEKLTVNRGQIIALIGINGSGKSSMLKSMAGINKFLNGEVLINGKKPESYNKRNLAQTLSFVSTKPIVFSHIDVFDFTLLGRYPHKNIFNTNNTHDELLVRQALNNVGMSNMAYSKLDSLSDGERQRVMIASALAQDTDIILLDEPASFLDIENKYLIYGILKKLAAEHNKTIIFSTHDLAIAIKFSDKLWLINEKKIIEGAPEDLICNNVFNNIFKNKDLNFDKVIMDYQFKPHLPGKVKIVNNSGKEYLFSAAQNFFRRNGFENCVDFEEFKLEISEKNNTLNLEIFVLGKKYMFKDFYSVQKFMNRQKSI